MDKPLKDWTLKEAKEFCEAKEYCATCGLARRLASGNYLCAISDEPAHWDLTDKPKYTADEIALAKLLLKAGMERIVKNSDTLLQMETAQTKAWWLPAKAFPSLEVGRIVGLKDIAESEAQNETD